MIFNAVLGGVSHIVVTAPSGASITATCSGVTVTGSGSCTLDTLIIGTWTVSCVYDGTTKTNTVSVESYGVSYQVSFTYTSTITVTCPSGASVVASMSGQSNVTRTGPGSITVPKKGTWTVKCTYDSTEKTNTVNVAAYDGTYTTSFTYTATITVTCPSGASVVASMSGQSNVTRTGPGNIIVPKKGTWTVKCTYDSTEKTNTVNVAAYDGTYTTSFTYTSTITVTCPSGASVVASMSGQDNVTRTGPGSITVPKKGTWTVKCTYDSTEKVDTVNVAAYDGTYATSFTYTSTITIVCPSGASVVASMSGQDNVTRTGPGSITVPKKGTWTVKCTYDSTEKTNTVNVAAYDGTYTTSFTYTSTITVTCPSGASVVASMSGQSNVTRTGPGNIIVPKKGTWTVKCTYDSIEKTNTVNVAAYDGTYTTSFTYFKAFVEVTVKAEAASSIQIKHNTSGTTYTASNIANGGSNTFTVRESGTWNITVSCNGRTGTDSVSVTTDNATYTKTVSIWYAYLNVTVRNLYGASTITISKSGQTTQTASNISTGGSKKFTVYSSGSWSVSASNTESKTITATVSATIGSTTNATVVVPYHIYLYSNGGTPSVGAGGLNYFGNSSPAATMDTNWTHGGWKVLYFGLGAGGGNDKMVTVNPLNLTGYTSINMNILADNVYYCWHGVSTAANISDKSTWAATCTISNNTALNINNPNWTRYSCSINTTASLFPILTLQNANSWVKINEWWLE